MARPLLLGHRGARKYAPENTLPALQLVLDHGCDGFEFDVRMTADMHAVICHDPKYLRKVIADSKRSELDVPALEEVVTRFAGKAFLNIELKVSGTESCTAELLRLHPFRGIVSSFLPEVIEKLAALKADVPLGLICESPRQLARWKDLPIRAVMANRGLVTESLVADLHAAGKQVFVWTVNSAREMIRFSAWGVEGLISDDTKLLAATFSASK
jgi:glycerophosphoryl diester phosphodiesterase